MIERIITIGTFLVGLCFYFFKKGETKQKNKQNAITLGTYEEANKTRKEVKNIPSDKLDSELDVLLND